MDCFIKLPLTLNDTVVKYKFSQKIKGRTIGREFSESLTEMDKKSYESALV